MIVVDLIGVGEYKVRDIVLSLVNEMPEIRYRVTKKTAYDIVSCFGGKFLDDISEEICCVPAQLKCDIEKICIQNSERGFNTAVLIDSYSQVKEAVLSGADYLIIRKPITDPPAIVGDVLNATKLVLREIESALRQIVDEAQILSVRKKIERR